MTWEPTPEQIEEKLTEMTYTWAEIEEQIELRATEDGDDRAQRLNEAIDKAFRVEAQFGRNGFGDPCTYYVLLFDVADRSARDAARYLSNSFDLAVAVPDQLELSKIINEFARPWHTRDHLIAKAVRRDTPIAGKVCARLGEGHPADEVMENVTEVSAETVTETTGVVVAEKVEEQGAETGVRRSFLKWPELETPESFPDWDLVARVEKLLRPYEDNDFPLRSFKLSVTDDRGRYDADDLEALKSEFDDRQSPRIDSIGVWVNGRDNQGSIYSFAVTISSEHAHARLEGDDEITVNGIASRLQEIFRDAAPKSEPEPEPRPRREPTPQVVSGPREEEESFTQRRLRDWKTYAGLAIAAGSLVVGILALIFK